ncbi:hypothetical protein POM88_002558 [Heracleum sosnowskyi]|uniref:Uncharacterized protein n=1 Tax=Heracleum sosnowskyi TaxID=360622 RepID=A0AAD8JFR2_9APIA|nr:hypothetical protein POM88_002558 [Heracleum sosnowskyi]
MGSRRRKKVRIFIDENDRMTFEKRINISDSWFTCLPALRILGLDNWDLSVSSFSLSFPNLTTLCLYNCTLPKKVWDLPALISLALYDFYYPYDMSDMLSRLTNLQDFTISLAFSQNHFISCPRQLVNLNIRTSSSRNECKSGNIVVLAPRIFNFTSFGIFTTTFGVPELENVNIRLQGWVQGTEEDSEKKLYHRLTNMLAGLGNAKNLTFDVESIEALNEISGLLVSLPSPFCNLNYVKLPKGYKESNMSSALRRYLLGGSPTATIFATLPQNTMKYQEVPNCLTSQKLMLDEALATNVNDRASSCRGNSDFGLWHGHEVNSDFVRLLDLIMTKYPETFEHFTAKSERVYTMKLNMLCTSVSEFLKTSLTEFNIDFITEYRDLFTDLQRWGFNVNWLLSHLKYTEDPQISQQDLHSIDSRPDDAEN